jgi:hypothetical protein
MAIVAKRRAGKSYTMREQLGRVERRSSCGHASPNEDAEALRAGAATSERSMKMSEANPSNIE